MKIKGRIVQIKRYPNEGLSFLTITIGGVKKFDVDDFVTLTPYKPPKKRSLKNEKPQAGVVQK